MGVEDRLTAALDEYATRARPLPGALDRVRDRALRRRRTQRARAGAGVAAVAVVAVAVPLLLRPVPAPPAPPVATATPTASPTPSVTPSPTVAPAPKPVRARPDEFVAVTRGRALVLVSSRTGKVTRRIAPVEAGTYALDLSPDGRTVLATIPSASGVYEVTNEKDCARVVEIDLTTGAQREVGIGWSAEYAPDGSRIAMNVCPGNGVRIMPTRGAPRTFLLTGLDEFVGPIAWSRDGRSLYVQWVGDDSNPFVRLDPATHRSLDEAERVATTHHFNMTSPVPWRDGLLQATTMTHMPREVYDNAYPLESDTLFLLPDAPDHPIEYVVAGPRDEILVVAQDGLWAWDGSGAPRHLGAGYPVIGW